MLSCQTTHRKMLHEQNQTYDDRSNDHTPLYNSRIINTYIEFIKKYYPDVDTDVILESAGISINEIEDPGQWFSQHQADRFHKIVVAQTGNKSIARDAGRYTASAKRIGAPKQYALGLMNLSKSGTLRQLEPRQFFLLTMRGRWWRWGSKCSNTWDIR